MKRNECVDSVLGINYIADRDARLEGCIPDTKTIQRLLTTKMGVAQENIKLLTDDKPDAMPTKANILKAIDWLVGDAKPGDCLFMHYSGYALAFFSALARFLIRLFCFTATARRRLMPMAMRATARMRPLSPLTTARAA